MTGVMDAGSQPAETAWVAGQDAIAEPASASAESAPVGDGPNVSEPSPESPERVAAVTEARVVMPKATGAGSWLRWPSSSADRSDSSR
jgi:hypothetical protein